MAQDEIFDIFHKYNRLVRRQLVKPLACYSCETPYITALGENDELVLTCVACDYVCRPGLDTISTVRAVVKEHFE